MSALTDTVRSMGKARIGAMVAAAAILFMFLLMFAFHMSTANMVPLYTDLSLQDSSKIVAELEKNAVPYELSTNGTEIMVPSERVLRLRMNMAEQGLPSGGSMVGYEIFDRDESFGSSDFVLNINMLRALEGELARTISSLSDVETARVHLVIPKQQIFTRDREKPSASITIKMRGGHALERSEVAAVSHLVASAVPGLEASRVTIVDGHGRLMARGDGDEGADGAASTAQEYRIAYENRMQQTLEDLIEKVIGAGKVRVQVAADMDFDRTVTNSEKYDPEGQVARSTQSNSEKETSQDKQAKESVTVANNLPQAPPASGDNGASSNHNTERSTETTNYEISKTVQNHVSEGGNIKKLSVAVLVDGTYGNKDDKQTYNPRTDDELKQIKALVSSAIGYDEKRGDHIEVVNMRFTQDSLDVGNESFFERFKLEMQSIIQTLIIAVVAILAIMLVLRPAVVQLIKTAQSPSERVADELSALEPGAAAGRLPGGAGMALPGQPSEADAMIDVANIKGGMKSSTMKKVNEIVDKYPQETMNVLRGWVAKQS